MEIDYILTDNIEDVPVFTGNSIYRYGDIMYQLADYKKAVDGILKHDRYFNSIIFKTICSLRSTGFNFLTREFHSDVKARKQSQGMDATVKECLYMHIRNYIDNNMLRGTKFDNRTIVNLRAGDTNNLSSDYIIDTINNTKNIDHITYMFVYNYDGRALNVFKRPSIAAKYKAINNILTENSIDQGYEYTNTKQIQQAMDVKSLINDVHKHTGVPYSFITTSDTPKVYYENPDFTDFQMAIACLENNTFIHNKNQLHGFAAVCDELKSMFN